MKQVAIVSGKGGTGKTTISSSLSVLAENIIVADCDVEAPNLHLIMGGNDISKEDYVGGRRAEIDPGKCIECGKCSSICKYGAIEGYSVNQLKCEGCGVCSLLCPEGAILFKDKKTGETFVTSCNGTVFSHAKLDIGADGSGKLVTKVRKNAMEYARGGEKVFIDGSPGIGCVVIASITGCDAVIVVTEPTYSGLEDLKRILSTCKHFGVEPYICINKYDLNNDMALEIEKYCQEKGYQIIGKIPYDERVLEALKAVRPVVEFEDSRAAQEIKRMYARIKILLEEDTDDIGYC